MSVTLGPRLGLMLDAAVGDVHPNEFRTFLRGIDALAQISVKSRTTAAQPGSPTNGDTYILPASATGTDWGGKATGTIAYYTTRKTTTTGGSDSTSTGWDFITPKRGFYANVEDESDALYTYDGSAWQVYYKTGTWTPTPTNLGGTSIVYDARYVQIGKVIHCTVKITGTALTSTAASTTLSVPFTASVFSAISCVGAGVTDLGSGTCSGALAYLPTVSSTTAITLSWNLHL